MTYVRLALPKGRLQSGVIQLLNGAGVQVEVTSRDYRPKINQPHMQVKILKHQNIVEMLHQNIYDLGFAGSDWVVELKTDLVELLDTFLDPFRIVVAAPTEFLIEGKLPLQKPLRVASEYEQLTKNWIHARNLNARYVRTYGATEVFPPEDADCIVDNTSTGATLSANGLTIVEELMHCSTRLYASRSALENPEKRQQIEHFIALLRTPKETVKCA